MLIKNANKRKILLCVVVSVLFLNIYSIPFSIAYDPATTVVKADWLSVTTGDFISGTLDPRENQLWINTGGKDLLSFTPLGISNVDTTDEVLVYKARAQFGFEVTMHTSVGFQDKYPNINTQVPHEVAFLGLIYQKFLQFPLVSVYSVGYDGIDFGDVDLRHDYTGYIPITVGMKSKTGDVGSIEVDGHIISTPYYTFDVMQSTIISVRDGEVGGYEDIFTDSTGVRDGTVDFHTTEESPSNQGVIDWLNTQALGWTTYDETTIVNLQQGEINADQVGSNYDNTNPAEDKSYTFRLGARLQPEVYQYIQTFKVRGAGIRFAENIWGVWEVEVIIPPHTKTIKRVVGVHVDNYFIHWDFVVDVDVYATVQSTAELTQSVLSDPYLKMGDYIWDPSYFGVSDIDILVPESTNNWWIILVLLIACIGIYIGYRVYKSQSQRKFFLQLAGRGT